MGYAYLEFRIFAPQLFSTVLSFQSLQFAYHSRQSSFSFVLVVRSRCFGASTFLYDAQFSVTSVCILLSSVKFQFRSRCFGASTFLYGAQFSVTSVCILLSSVKFQFRSRCFRASTFLYGAQITLVSEVSVSFSLFVLAVFAPQLFSTVLRLLSSVKFQFRSRCSGNICKFIPFSTFLYIVVHFHSSVLSFLYF